MGEPHGGAARGNDGTSGAVNVEKARERGAEIGEKAAVATEKVRETAAVATEKVQSTHDATITAKIKAKMALDDLVKARTIDVTTDGTTVTLKGTTALRWRRANHRRAAVRAGTAGVAEVVDDLRVATR